MDVRKLGLSEEDLRALGYAVKVGPAGEGSEEAPMDPTAETRTAGTGDGWRWVWTWVALVLLSWNASLDRRLPAPVPANQPDTVFSSARAMSQLVEIARRPHPVGSPEHARVRTHLLERLRALGLDPRVQAVPSTASGTEFTRAATLHNVLVRIPGTASTGALAVMAHYDTSPLSPGAGDNGTGVAAILEMVRAVSSGAPLRNDVVVVLTDGQGVGLSGGGAFADHHPWMADVRRVITVEMRGVSGPALTFETETGNRPLVRHLAEVHPRPTATSLARELSAVERLGLDVGRLQDWGISGLSLTALGGRSTHGQVTDRAIRVREPTLQHQGMQLLATVRAYGSQDLRTDASGVDAAYFTVPLFGLVHHPLAWIRFLSMGLVGGWMLLGLVLWLRKRTYRGVLAGLALSLLFAGGGMLLGRGLLRALEQLHPEYGYLETAFYSDGQHFLALTALIVALVAGGYAVARKWFAAEELLMGALALPLGVAVWLGIRAPFAAMALQWALAASLLSTLVFVALGPTHRSGRWAWAGFLLLSGLILSILVPHLELTAAVLTFREAPLVGGLIALCLLLLLPTSEWLIRPRGWWTPGVALLAGATLVALALPAVQGGADHPVSSSLVYLVDGTTAAEALRIDAEETDSDGDSTSVRRVEGKWLLVPGSGEDWGRSWVAEEEVGSKDPGVLLLPLASHYRVAGSGPDAELAPPRLRVLHDSVADGLRRLRLAVRSGLQGEMMGVHLPNGGRLTSLGGSPLGPEAGPGQSVVHWGMPGPSDLEFDVTVAAGQEPLEILILEHHLRPQEVLGEGFFRRGEALIPDPRTGSDRIIQRTRVTLPAAASPDA
jgi:hypothetical protein